jgi:hypothetical protein
VRFNHDSPKALVNQCVWDVMQSTLISSPNSGARILSYLRRGGASAGNHIFFNKGVRLTVKGSPVLDALKDLSQKRVEIISRGTCLGHFNLKEKLAVGEVSNIYTITEIMLNAARVVSL